MAAQLNYANLLAFVQVGVALNFGLLFLTRRNVLKDVYKEFQCYLKAISNECINYAQGHLEQIGPMSNEDKRKQKASVNRCLNKLKYIFNRELDTPHLSCWGVYSGLYGFMFLYIVGMLNWRYDFFLLDLLIVQAEIVCILEIAIWVRVHNRRKKDNIRIMIAMNFQWFVVSSLIALALVACNNIIHIPVSRDCFFLLCSLVSYTPILWLVGMMIVDLIRVYYWKKKCRIHIDYLIHS